MQLATKLIIWGCGGQGRELNLLCEQIGLEVVGFLDERPDMKGKVIDDVPVLGDIVDITGMRGKVKVICSGVGDPALKKRFFMKTIKAGFDIAEPLVHPSVYISKRNSIEVGSVICDGSILTVNVRIGEHVLINRGCNIGHDTAIGDFTTISPGVNISGNVSIEEGVFIGTGASIREKLQIGSWSNIGGGAFVNTNVKAETLFAGVPAVLKKRLRSQGA